jgi:hypothetical protein
MVVNLALTAQTFADTLFCSLSGADFEGVLLCMRYPLKQELEKLLLLAEQC